MTVPIFGQNIEKLLIKFEEFYENFEFYMKCSGFCVFAENFVVSLVIIDVSPELIHINYPSKTLKK